MFKRNRVSVLAMLASFSLLPFTACNDDIVSGTWNRVTKVDAGDETP